MKKAKRQLWAIVVKQIKVGSLITYISTNHPDDGKGAIDYIVGCFAAGVDKLKLKATDKQYLTYMREARGARTAIVMTLSSSWTPLSC